MSETVEAALRQRIAELEHNVAAWQKVADENIARRRELEAEVVSLLEERATLSRYGDQQHAQVIALEGNMRELERELGEVRAELEGRR